MWDQRKRTFIGHPKRKRLKQLSYTLAHTIARHAGYNVREINASDDRSPEAFKLALENGTQMSSVLNADKRPNCIVLGGKAAFKL